MIIIDEDRKKLCQVATELIIKRINALSREKREIVLGITGGKSLPGVFELLKGTRSLPWDKVHIFFVDERNVALEEESYFRQAVDSFLQELVSKKVLPKDNIHPFRFKAAKPAASLKAYEAELKECGGAFDIVLLSAGEDGHIAGLFPHHHGLTDNAEYFQLMDDAPKPPPQRMTLSRHLLHRTGMAITLFFGEGKRDAFRKFADQTLDFNACPAKLASAVKDAYALTDLMP